MSSHFLSFECCSLCFFFVLFLFCFMSLFWEAFKLALVLQPICLTFCHALKFWIQSNCTRCRVTHCSFIPCNSLCHLQRMSPCSQADYAHTGQTRTGAKLRCSAATPTIGLVPFPGEEERRMADGNETIL